MKAAIELLFWVVALSCYIYAVFGLVRNHWVYKQQTKLNRFEGDVHVCDLYLSYDQMMRKFWIWDVEKLRLPSK